MATVTLEGIVYDGETWAYDEGRRRPNGDTPGRLYDLGFRQARVYNPKYDEKVVLDSPTKERVEPNSTVVVVDDRVVAVLTGNRTDAAAPVVKAPRKAAKKVAKKAAKKQA